MAIVDDAFADALVNALAGAALVILNVGFHLLVVAAEFDLVVGEELRQSGLCDIAIVFVVVEETEPA